MIDGQGVEKATWFMRREVFISLGLYFQKMKIIKRHTIPKDWGFQCMCQVKCEIVC